MFAVLGASIRIHILYKIGNKLYQKMFLEEGGKNNSQKLVISEKLFR